MKIKIINPNTTQSMTESIENLARRVARSDTQVWAVTPASGPDSIECYVDEYLAVPGVLKEVIRGDREEGADAFIIACFGDPGLQAAREVTSKPVLGIGHCCCQIYSAVLFYRIGAGSVSQGHRGCGVQLWSGKVLPFYPIHRFERAGIWQGPQEGIGSVSLSGKVSRAAGRRRMYFAGVRWFRGLC